MHPYDILAMNGASAALMISDIPLPTPVGAVRIGKVDGNFVVNPTEEDLLENTDLDLIVAGTDEAILMVEAGANEVPEAEILDALDIAHAEIKKLCAAQRELRREGRQGRSSRSRRRSVDAGLLERDQGLATAPQLDDGHAGRGQARAPGRDQGRRGRRRRAVRRRPRGRHATPSTRPTPQLAFDRAREDRRSASGSPSRRSAPTAARETEIRPITIEVGVAPRTHGSALFTRGQTQALSASPPSAR